MHGAVEWTSILLIDHCVIIFMHKTYVAVYMGRTIVQLRKTLGVQLSRSYSIFYVFTRVFTPSLMSVVPPSQP